MIELFVAVVVVVVVVVVVIGAVVVVVVVFFFFCAKTVKRFGNIRFMIDQLRVYNAKAS